MFDKVLLRKKPLYNIHQKVKVRAEFWKHLDGVAKIITRFHYKDGWAYRVQFRDGMRYSYQEEALESVERRKPTMEPADYVLPD